MTPPAAGPDTEPALAAALAGVLGGSIASLCRLSGGASRTTWSFDHRRDGATRALVVQIHRRDGAASGMSATTETRLLEVARAGGVPAPAVVAHGTGDGLGGTWVVTELVEGETIPRKLLRDSQYAAARADIVRQCAQALGAIHALALSDLPPLPDADQLDQFADILHAFEPSRPALELALRRLRATRPPPGDRALVHGDFRTGNLVVGPDGLRAVLDWELAHVGDPLEDLGWFCVRAWRFGGPGRAGGFGSSEDLLDGYRAATGRRADAGAVGWWEAVGTFKWAVICMVQAATPMSGGRRSVEHTAIGRRVCENEWDLLALLGARSEEVTLDAPPGGDGAADGDDGTGTDRALPFGRPSARQLVEAARQFLHHEVVAGTQGRLAFHARVAGNALAIVGRELELGPAVAERQAARLAGLGFDGEESLSAAIRSGVCDDRWDEVAGVIAGSVRDQLTVANPGHLDPGN